MIDDVSGFYLKNLYPLAYEFETKLRKFITWSLIDITETVSSPIKQYFSKIKDFDSTNNTFNTNVFLSSWTLEATFKFLFEKPSLLEETRKIIKERINKNNNIGKVELINLISSITEKSVWEEFFEQRYVDCTLPSIYKGICSARNDIMHFHKINHKKNESLKTILIRGIKEIDLLLANAVQIEPNDENVSKLVVHTEYIVNILNSFTQSLLKINIPDEKWVNSLSESLNVLKSFSIEGLVAQTKMLSELSNNLMNTNLLPIFDRLKGLSDYNEKMYKYLNSAFKEIIDIESNDENREENNRNSRKNYD